MYSLWLHAPLIQSFKSPGVYKSYKKNDLEEKESLYLRNSGSIIYKCKSGVLEVELNSSLAFHIILKEPTLRKRKELS